MPSPALAFAGLKSGLDALLSQLGLDPTSAGGALDKTTIAGKKGRTNSADSLDGLFALSLDAFLAPQAIPTAIVAPVQSGGAFPLAVTAKPARSQEVSLPLLTKAAEQRVPNVMQGRGRDTPAALVPSSGDAESKSPATLHVKAAASPALPENLQTQPPRSSANAVAESLGSAKSAQPNRPRDLSKLDNQATLAQVPSQSKATASPDPFAASPHTHTPAIESQAKGAESARSIVAAETPALSEGKKASIQALQPAATETSASPATPLIANSPGPHSVPPSFQQNPPAVDQIKEAVTSRAEEWTRTGRIDIRLRLHPPELGEIRVQLSSTEHEATGKLMVREAATKTLLETHMAQLHDRLGEFGIRLDRLDVVRESFDAGSARLDLTHGGHAQNGTGHGAQSSHDFHREEGRPTILSVHQPAVPARMVSTHRGQVDLLA